MKILAFILCSLCLGILEGEPLNVEAKAGLFFPVSNRVKRICSEVIPIYEIEIDNMVCSNWNPWVSVGYISNPGVSLGEHHNTSFWLVPVTVGLKYVCSLSPCAHVYGGLGGCWSFFQSTDLSPFVHKHIFNNGPGGLAKVGYVFRVNDLFQLDFQASYLYQYFTFHHHYKHKYTGRNNLDMSGIQLTAGVKYSF